MARYVKLESSTMIRLNRILVDAHINYEQINDVIYDLRDDISEAQEAEYYDMYGRCKSTYLEAKKNVDDENRRIWYPAYLLYAEDNKLQITEETCLKICNKHHKQKLISTKRVVNCSCSLVSQPNVSVHTYTFGDVKCAANTEMSFTFHDENKWGFIASEDPKYCLCDLIEVDLKK